MNDRHRHRNRPRIHTLCFIAVAFVFLFGVALIVLHLNGISSDDVKEIVRNRLEYGDAEASIVKPEVCTPEQNVFFLRTLNPSSSTVFNIFARFAEENGRTFVIPKERSLFEIPPHNSIKTDVYDFESIHRKPEIFAVRARFNLDAAKSLMPKKTKFVTILSDPVKAFVDTYLRYNLQKQTGHTIETFHQNRSLLNRWKLRDSANPLIGKPNQFFWDLGFDEVPGNVEGQAQKAIDYLEKNFELVMIHEFMEDSLALLKNHLCWTSESLIAFRHNERKDPYAISETLYKTYESLNLIDMIIYKHFREKFLREVQNESGLVMTEVEKFKLQSNYWRYQCVAKMTNTTYPEFVCRENVNRLCDRLTRSEEKYVQFFRELYDKESSVNDVYFSDD